MAPTHYDVLGVSQDASLDDIKAAHRKLSLILHPDKQKKSASNNQRRRTEANKAKQSQHPSGSLHAIDDDSDDNDASVREGTYLNNMPEKLEQLALGDNSVQSSEASDANMKGAELTTSAREAATDDNIEPSKLTKPTEKKLEYTFRQIHSAFEALRDPTTRAAYDDELSRKSEKSASKVDKAVPVKLSEMEEILFEEVEGYDEGTGGNEDCNGGDDVNEDGCEVAYCYQCRCGDEIQVRQEDIATEQGHRENENIFECPSCCLCIRIEVDVLPDKQFGNNA